MHLPRLSIVVWFASFVPFLMCLIPVYMFTVSVQKFYNLILVYYFVVFGLYKILDSKLLSIGGGSFETGIVKKN